MVNSVSSSAVQAPVQTVQMFDPSQKKIRKLTNKTEAVEEYMKETNRATDKMFSDALWGSTTASIVGISGSLLYDGIKKSKFYPLKAVSMGVFGAIAGFCAIAAVEYKTKVRKVTEKFINHSEQSFPLENKFTVKSTDFVNTVPVIKETNI